MLKKRSRSHQKGQHMGSLRPGSSIVESTDNLGQKQKTSSFFNIPALFVGFSPKTSESDSVRSPTSPLDFTLFLNFGNPFRSPRSSSHEGHQKTWDSSKVGLSIIDSLDDDDDDVNQWGKILGSSDSKHVLFGPQMRIKTLSFHACMDSFEASNSLSNNCAIAPHTHQIKTSNLQLGYSDILFGIGETVFQPEASGKILSCSLDSGKSSITSGFGNFDTANGTNPVSLTPQFSRESHNLGNSSTMKLNQIPVLASSAHHLIGSFSASEIELSEDYTCVRTYGPNPKITHIFDDCILECHENSPTNFPKSDQKELSFTPAVAIECSKTHALYPSSDFLSFCYSCKKKLEGEDIYMYRGEKAFCSWGCRSQEILIEEAMEKTTNNSPENPEELSNDGELSETTMFVAT